MVNLNKLKLRKIYGVCTKGNAESNNCLSLNITNKLIEKGFYVFHNQIQGEIFDYIACTDDEYTYLTENISHDLDIVVCEKPINNPFITKLYYRKLFDTVILKK